MKETREQMIARRERSAVIQAKRKERVEKYLDEQARKARITDIVDNFELRLINTQARRKGMIQKFIATRLV